MKRALFSALLFTAVSFCQEAPSAGAAVSSAGQASSPATVTEHRTQISRSDVYCSGYLDSKPINKNKFVIGGLYTPHTARFVDHDLIFLTGGGYQPGTRVAIVRQWKDPDPDEIYKGTRKLLAQAGHPFADLGYARVLEIRGKDVAVAQIEFSCDAIVPGDLVTPFTERQMVKVGPTATTDRFPVSTDGPTATIVLARDGDQVIRTGSKVYLNAGLKNGLKVGDYFQVVRGYTPQENDEADNATLKSSIMDDTQKDPPHVPNTGLDSLPKKLLGELVILNANEGTSTAMVTYMLEEMHVGDKVQKEAVTQ